MFLGVNPIDWIYNRIYSPDPENILKACDEAALSAHAALKQGDEGVQKDRVIWKIWLFRG